jgi:hypothetical protein
MAVEIIKVLITKVRKQTLGKNLETKVGNILLKKLIYPKRSPTKI